MKKIVVTKFLAGLLASAMILTSAPLDVLATITQGEITEEIEDENTDSKKVELEQENINKESFLIESDSSKDNEISEDEENTIEDVNYDSYESDNNQSDLDSSNDDIEEEQMTISETEFYMNSSSEEINLSDIKYTDVYNNEIDIAAFNNDQYNHMRFVVFANNVGDYDLSFWYAVTSAMPEIQSENYEFIWVDNTEIVGEDGEAHDGTGVPMTMKDHLENAKKGNENGGLIEDCYVPGLVSSYKEPLSKYNYAAEYKASIKGWANTIVDHSTFVQLNNAGFNEELIKIIKAANADRLDSLPSGKAFVASIKFPENESDEAAIVKSYVFDETDYESISTEASFFHNIIEDSWEYLHPYSQNGQVIADKKIKDVIADHEIRLYSDDSNPGLSTVNSYSGYIGELFFSDDGVNFNVIKNWNNNYLNVGVFSDSTMMPEKGYYKSVQLDSHGLPKSISNTVCNFGNVYFSYNCIDNYQNTTKDFEGIALGTYENDELKIIDPREGITLHVGEGIKVVGVMINVDENGNKSYVPFSDIDWSFSGPSWIDWYTENLSDTRINDNNRKYWEFKSDSEELTFKSKSSLKTPYESWVKAIQNTNGANKSYITIYIDCSKDSNTFNDKYNSIGNNNIYFARIPVTVLPGTGDDTEYPDEAQPFFIEKGTENASQLLASKIIERAYMRSDEAIYVDKEIDIDMSVLAHLDNFYEEREGMMPWEGDYLREPFPYEDSKIGYIGPFEVEFDHTGERRTYNMWKATIMRNDYRITWEQEQEINEDLDILFGRNDAEDSPLESHNGKKWDASTTNALRNAYSQYKNGGISDEAAIKAVYNWITKNVSGFVGQRNSAEERMDMANHWAYTALEKGYGTCQAFATLFTRMSREMGVPSRVIMGTDANAHTYNIVRNGDWWYYIDTSTNRYLSDAKQFKRTTEQEPYLQYKFVKNYLYKIKNYKESLTGKVDIYRNDELLCVATSLLEAQEIIEYEIKEEKNQNAELISDYKMVLKANTSIVSSDELYFDIEDYDYDNHTCFNPSKYVSLDLNNKVLTVRSEQEAKICIGHVYNGTINIENNAWLDVDGYANTEVQASHDDRVFRSVYEKVKFVGKNSKSRLNLGHLMDAVYLDSNCEINVANVVISAEVVANSKINAIVLTCSHKGYHYFSSMCEKDIHLGGNVTTQYMEIKMGTWGGSGTKQTLSDGGLRIFVNSLKVSKAMKMSHGSHLCVEGSADITNLGTLGSAETIDGDISKFNYVETGFFSPADYDIGPAYIHPVTKYNGEGDIVSQGTIKLYGNIDGSRFIKECAEDREPLIPFEMSPMAYREEFDNAASEFPEVGVPSENVNKAYQIGKFKAGDLIGYIDSKVKARVCTKNDNDEVIRTAYENITNSNIPKYFDVSVQDSESGIAGCLDESEWFVAKRNAITVKTTLHDETEKTAEFTSTKAALKGLDTVAGKANGVYTFVFDANDGLRSDFVIPNYVTGAIFESAEGKEYTLDLNGKKISSAGSIEFKDGLNIISTGQKGKIEQTGNSYSSENYQATEIKILMTSNVDSEETETNPKSISRFNNVDVVSKKGDITIIYQPNYKCSLKNTAINAGMFNTYANALNDESASIYPLEIDGNVTTTQKSTKTVKCESKINSQTLITGKLTCNSDLSVNDELRVVQDIKATNISLGADCTIISNGEINVSGVLDLYQNALIIPGTKMSVGEVNLCIDEDAGLEADTNAYIYKKSNVPITFKGTSINVNKQSNPEITLKLGIGVIDETTNLVDDSLETIINYIVDYQSQTKVGNYTAGKFDVSNLYAVNSNENNMYTDIYSVGKNLYVGRNSFVLYTDINKDGIIEDSTERVNSYYRWADIVTEINKKIKDEKLTSFRIDVRDNVFLDDTLNLNFKATDVTIRGINCDGSEINDDTKKLISFIGNITPTVSNLEIDNIEMKAVKLNTKTGIYDDSPCNISLGKNSLNLENCTVWSVGTLNQSKPGVLKMKDCYITQSTSISANDMILDSVKIKNKSSFSCGTTLDIKNTVIDSNGKVSLKNIISRDDKNKIIILDKADKNLVITGAITSSDDCEQSVYKIDNCFIIEPDESEIGENEKIGSIRKCAIDIEIKSLFDQIIPRTVIATTDIAPSCWFVVGSDCDEEGNRNSIKALSNKIDKKIMISSADALPVELSSSDSIDGEYDYLGGYYSITEALKEISRIKDKTVYYKIVLDNDTIGTDANSVNNTKSGISFPNTAAKIRVESNIKDDTGNTRDAVLAFNGNPSIGCNVEFKNIVFKPNSSVMAINGGVYRVQLSDCKMAEGKSISTISGKGTLDVYDSDLTINGNLSEKYLVLGRNGEGVKLTVRGSINVETIVNDNSIIDTTVSVTRPKNSTGISKLVSNFTITGEVYNTDEYVPLRIDLSEKKTVNKVDSYEHINMSDCINILPSGIQLVKTKKSPSENVRYAENLDSPNSIQKKNSIIVITNADNTSKLVYDYVDIYGNVKTACTFTPNIQSAIDEINSLNNKRYYEIRVLSDTAGTPTIKFPTSKVASSLKISGYKLDLTNNRMLTRVLYDKELSLGCETIFENLILDATKATPGKPAALSLNGNTVKMSETVWFTNYLNIQGKNGKLIIPKTATVNTATELQSGQTENKVRNLIFGNITGMDEVHIEGMEDAPYYDLHVTNELSAKKLSLDNCRICADGKGTFDDIKIEDDPTEKKSELAIGKEFVINKNLYINSDGATFVTSELIDTKKKSSGESYLTLKGKITRTDAARVKIKIVNIDLDSMNNELVPKYKSKELTNGNCLMNFSGEIDMNTFAPHIDCVDSEIAGGDGWPVKYDPANNVTSGYRLVNQQKKLKVFFEGL